MLGGISCKVCAIRAAIKGVQLMHVYILKRIKRLQCGMQNSVLCDQPLEVFTQDFI